ncbi:MAG: DNA-protecting protein DprA [Phototrophicales bacterium]|nr:MAG: DNA-protecting protein DprA [Phototrophicales bacterium]
MSDLRYWLALNLVEGIGSGRLRSLYRYFQGDMAAAWFASQETLLNAGLDLETIQNLQRWRKRLNVEGAYQRLGELGIHICTLNDEHYPKLLREIHDAPPMLYHIGDLLPTDIHSLAIVGTRRATTYGQDVARAFARELAQAGLTIVSGLAKGIDAAAHQGALDANGRTIAVLANGLHEIYPTEHTQLAKSIVASGGALISEYPPTANPDSRHFPVRNRLLSGLSLGVLIVEAPKGSGALYTAAAAVEQDRDVFAIPGQIFQVNTYGPHRLIQDGAKLVTCVEDILEELNLEQRTGIPPHPRIPRPHPPQNTQANITPSRPIQSDDPIETAILGCLEDGPLHVDDIAFCAQSDIQIVQAKLMVMVIKGWVEEEGTMVYKRL